ncbi:hypothetical protein M0R45_026206 [Rubus argutus]|uniref:MHC class I antigen n=1 Tax=Rubus argutus TaxID=59490 RepID=A0AAW1WXI5_RUBAR
MNCEVRAGAATQQLEHGRTEGRRRSSSGVGLVSTMCGLDGWARGGREVELQRRRDGLVTVATRRGREIDGEGRHGAYRGWAEARRGWTGLVAVELGKQR